MKIIDIVILVLLVSTLIGLIYTNTQTQKILAVNQQLIKDNTMLLDQYDKLVKAMYIEEHY